MGCGRRQSGRTDSRRCGDHPDGNAIRGRRSGGPLWVHRGPRQGGPRPPGAPPGAPQWRRNSRGDVVCDEFQSVPVCPLWVPQGVPAFSTNTLMMENHMIEYRDLRDARSKCSRVAALTTRSRRPNAPRWRRCGPLPGLVTRISPGSHQDLTRVCGSRPRCGRARPPLGAWACPPSASSAGSLWSALRVSSHLIIYN